MLHMAAYYYATLLAADGLKALPPVSDTIFATSGTGLLLPTDLKLVGAYAGSTLILRARVNAPSFLRVGFPSIRPVMQNAVSGAASADPNATPSFLRGLAALGAFAGVSGTAAFGLRPRPIFLASSPRMAAYSGATIG